MKIQLVFTKKEAQVLAEVTKAYDFTNHINAEKLSKKYNQSASAGSFNYSGITSDGAEVTLETNEKLLLAAGRVYLKYADTVNGILCNIKSLVVSCKGLFNNFINDYTKELNTAFEEIRQEVESEKEEEKKNEEIVKEIKDLFEKAKK